MGKPETDAEGIDLPNAAPCPSCKSRDVVFQNIHEKCRLICGGCGIFGPEANDLISATIAWNDPAWDLRLGAKTS